MEDVKFATDSVETEREEERDAESTVALWASVSDDHGKEIMSLTS